MYTPTDADRVTGSAALRRRQWAARLLARGLRRPDVRLTVGPAIDRGRVPDGQLISRQQMRAATVRVRIALAELVVETAPDLASVAA